MKLVSPGMSMDEELRASASTTTTTHKISYFIDFPGLCSSSSSAPPRLQQQGYLPSHYVSPYTTITFPLGIIDLSFLLWTTEATQLLLKATLGNKSPLAIFLSISMYVIFDPASNKTIEVFLVFYSEFCFSFFYKRSQEYFIIC